MDNTSPTDSPELRNFSSNLEVEIATDDDLWKVDTRDREAGPDGHPLKLADWSAQDFASIYTRFRPHLERHARRFLTNPSQVDEVVQDAFLYLMVTLPELDSELGVLRFLKWKTRLLCLDVLRASGRAQLSDIDAHPEFEAENSDVSADIEQAEDAAIVRLALSKLNPRHREVLIASIYEEKTSAQIAAQVGLTENATNQLIFRARAAFKKALLGDGVDTTGMSTAKILSVAARKAALEAKKVGAQAMVFALFLILGVGAFVNFSGRNSSQITAAPQQTPSSTSAPASAPTESEAPVTPENEFVQNSANVATPANTPKASPSPTLAIVKNAELLEEEAFMAATLATVQKSQITSSTLVPNDNRQLLTVRGETLSASFEYGIEKHEVSSLVLRFEVDDEVYKTFPTGFTVDEIEPGEYLLLGQMGYFVDTEARIVKNNPLQAAGFMIRIKIDTYGQVYSADIQLKK